VAALLLEGAPKELALLVERARNLAFAFKALGMTQKDNLGVVVASLEGSAAAAFEPAMTANFGKKSARRIGARTAEVWPARGPDEPPLFRAPLPSSRSAVGLAVGGLKAVDWFYGRPSPKPATGPTPLIAAARLDVPRMIDQFARADPFAGAIAADVAKKLGALSGSLRLVGQTLVGTARLEIK
jgi:hypothetical protein